MKDSMQLSIGMLTIISPSNRFRRLNRGNQKSIISSLQCREFTPVHGQSANPQAWSWKYISCQGALTQR